MAFGQSSFRRILLSRLLLLVVPVLVIGFYVTYRKARSAFLESARQNLTESAVLKGESIQQSIEAMRVNLAMTSNSIVLNSGSAQERQQFVERLARQQLVQIECVQLLPMDARQSLISTCGEQPLANAANNAKTVLWPLEITSTVVENMVQVEFVLPPQSVTSERQNPQLSLVFSAPVYLPSGRLGYILSVQATILQQEEAEPGSLQGSLVVINEAGTILAHPIPRRVGRNIAQAADADRLQSLMNGALSGRQDFLHLFSFEKNGVELVAGYSAIANPISQESGQKWVIVALTPLDSALAPLKDIQQVLSLLMLALLGASIMATIFIAAVLARPVERLRDYALNIEYKDMHQAIPRNFRIREFKQLAIALNEMFQRLQQGNQEILRAWQEANKANEIKSEFLATTSHELRTPLNGIINSIRIVADGFCDSREEEQEFLKQADDAAIHLLGIINDVLDISKIEAGKLTVKLQLLELNTLLTEVIEIHQAQVQRKGLELHYELPSQGIWVNADPAKLKQVFLNILGNAIKFTESGSITIGLSLRSHHQELMPLTQSEPMTESLPSNNPVALALNAFSSSQVLSRQQVVTTRTREGIFNPKNANQSGENLRRSPRGSDSTWVMVTVQDTGIGIAPEQQPKLFQPFVMVDGSTTRRFGGTGLGLAISRNLLELMGGAIDLVSDGEGKGTTVRITLPSHQPPSDPTNHSTLPSSEP